MFTAALFIIAKYWKQPKYPSSVNECIKNCGTFTQWNTYYIAQRKKELLPFAMEWMKLENIMLSEISQSVKDKYPNKRNLMNKIN